MALTVTRSIPLSLALSGALALGATACGGRAAQSSTSSATSTTATATTQPNAPACRSSWLTVTVLSATASRPTGRRAHDVVTVSTTRTCALSGWPRFEKIPADFHKAAGARPAWRTVTTGGSETVILLPGSPATATATVVVPRADLWPGGNICAASASALVRPGSVSKAFFVEAVPSAYLLCGATAAVTVTVGHFTVTATPATTTSVVSPLRAPKGWLEVPFGNVEVRADPSWLLETDGGGPCLGDHPTGQVVLGGAKPVTGCVTSSLGFTTVHLNDISEVPPPYATMRPQELNGLEVIRGPWSADHAVWYVPEYLEAVSVTGPYAQVVADSLRADARPWVLGNGPIVAPLKGWKTITWRGLSFKVPGSFKVDHESLWNVPLCQMVYGSLDNHEVLLDNDARAIYPACPYEIPTVESVFAFGGTGVRVDLHPSRPWSGRAKLSTRCVRSDNGLKACAYAEPQLGFIVFDVTGGGLAHPRLFWLGLSGSGQLDRSILYSLQAAPAH